jgi:hypothetical protein
MTSSASLSSRITDHGSGVYLNWSAAGEISTPNCSHHTTTLPKRARSTPSGMG